MDQRRLRVGGTRREPGGNQVGATPTPHTETDRKNETQVKRETLGNTREIRMHGQAVTEIFYWQNCSKLQNTN